MYGLEVKWIMGEFRYIGEGTSKCGDGIKLHCTPHKEDAMKFTTYLKAEAFMFEMELDGEAKIVTL